jgi:hypothetical protein
VICFAEVNDVRESSGSDFQPSAASRTKLPALCDAERMNKEVHPEFFEAEPFTSVVKRMFCGALITWGIHQNDLQGHSQKKVRTKEGRQLVLREQMEVLRRAPQRFELPILKAHIIGIGSCPGGRAILSRTPVMRDLESTFPLPDFSKAQGHLLSIITQIYRVTIFLMNPTCP